MLLIIGSDSADPSQWPKFARTISHQQTLIMAANRVLIEQNNDIIERLDRIMASNEEIMVEVEELQASVGVISTGIDTMQSDLDTANSRLLELEASGLAPATVAALRGAVDNVQKVADRFKAAVDPKQETPDEATAPEPVADVPTDATADAPLPEGEPAVVVDDSEPVAADVAAEEAAVVEADTATEQ